LSASRVLNGVEATPTVGRSPENSGLFSGLLGPGAACGFGIRTEWPVDFDSIALLQSVIRLRRSAEYAECRMYQIDSRELRIESGQPQRVRNPGPGCEVKGLDDGTPRLGVGDLDLERGVVHLPAPLSRV
jgi:hypothetical protein